MAAVACSGGSDVRDGIKSEIRERVTQRTGAEVQSVTCPKDVKLEDGARFACAVALPGGAILPIRIAMTGASTYQLDWASLDRWKVESQLGAAMRTEWPGLEPRQVQCPAEAAPGATLRCKVAILQGTEIEVTVRIADDRRIDYTAHGVHSLTALEKAIVDRMGPQGQTATADCGGKVRYAPPNASFECTVRRGDGSETRAVVTVRDRDGNVAWVLR